METIIANKFNFLRMDKELKKKCNLNFAPSLFSLFPNAEIIPRWYTYVSELNNNLDEIWFSDKYINHRIAAKHISRYADAEFSRGEKLYDYRCDSCENVNEHMHVLKTIKQYSLDRFM
ncbi:MAG: hypothetical protein ABIG46_03630 [Candidatus Omnitrophota bacterium]